VFRGNVVRVGDAVDRSGKVGKAIEGVNDKDRDENMNGSRRTDNGR